MVAQPTTSARAPDSIEDFLWSLHSVLTSAPGAQVEVDSLKDVYFKQTGNKCNIERWLVVGNGGLAATCKRIPHIVTVFSKDGTNYAKATQPASATKELLIEADQAFRRELQKKNAAAKAAKAAGTAPPKPAPPAVPPKAAEAAATKAPTRPPATIQDFLWNLHTVMEAHGEPLPVDELKDVYSAHVGHKFAIERFLVVGAIGLAGTLKRVPHVVTLSNVDGKDMCSPTLPNGTTREGMMQADKEYLEKLKQKHAEAKAKAAAPASTKAAAPAPAPAPAVQEASAGQKRPADAASEPDAKKPKAGGDVDQLSRMLVQGVVRVLQHRVKEGKDSLRISDLPEEFKALWKVPFNLQSAGFSDVSTFIKAWPNKIDLVPDAAGDIVALAKKPSEAAAKPPPAVPKPAAEAAPAAAGEPEAKKAKTGDQETLSKMLVQGVVRVLQSRAKEGKGDLLVQELPEEFKTLWKVPFNLASAGYSDVNTFLKAWPNKLEVTSSAKGDVVALTKKVAEKAGAGPATAAKAPAGPPKTSAPAAAKAAGADVNAPIPSTSAELRKELARNMQDLENLYKQQNALVGRQKSLIEALNRLS